MPQIKKVKPELLKGYQNIKRDRSPPLFMEYSRKQSWGRLIDKGIIKNEDKGAGDARMQDVHESPEDKNTWFSVKTIKQIK